MNEETPQQPTDIELNTITVEGDGSVLLGQLLRKFYQCLEKISGTTGIEDMSGEQIAKVAESIAEPIIRDNVLEIMAALKELQKEQVKLFFGSLDTNRDKQKAVLIEKAQKFLTLLDGLENQSSAPAPSEKPIAP